MRKSEQRFPSISHLANTPDPGKHPRKSLYVIFRIFKMIIYIFDMNLIQHLKIGRLWWSHEKKDQLSDPWICYEQWAYLFRSVLPRLRGMADELDHQGREGTCYRKKDSYFQNIVNFVETYITRYYSWEAGSLVARWTVWLPALFIVQTSTGPTTQPALKFVACWVCSSLESFPSRISMLDAG